MISNKYVLNKTQNFAALEKLYFQFPASVTTNPAGQLVMSDYISQWLFVCLTSQYEFDKKKTHDEV